MSLSYYSDHTHYLYQSASASDETNGQRKILGLFIYTDYPSLNQISYPAEELVRKKYPGAFT